jgi:uncharacterized protein YjbJ (UPF0337 family)
LTDDQLDVIAGKRDQLLGKLQEKYGLSKDDAEATQKLRSASSSEACK